MPVYLYRCPTCGSFEAKHSMQEKLEECPTCSNPVTRVPVPINWLPKCSGFYRTDKVLSDKQEDE